MPADLLCSYTTLQMLEKSSALPKQISKVSQGNDFQSTMWDRRVCSIYIITSKMAHDWHQTIAEDKEIWKFEYPPEN